MKFLAQLFFLVFLSITFDVIADSHIKTGENRTMLTVCGEPFIILGGELGNSSASCVEDISENIKKLSEKGLNTVLVPIYWDLLEPEEGIFDFSLIDHTIKVAGESGVKIVFLWFGAWKNSMSCYAPGWVKRDINRFPRVKTEEGKPMEILTAFSPEVLESDKNAFVNLLQHIKKVDSYNTVVLVQIENEVGMLEGARDFSLLANKEYDKGVPGELTSYLKENYNKLHPWIKQRWDDNGNKLSGNWREVFGDDIYADECFTAWSYATYIEELAKQGKSILEIPLYVNAALNSRGRQPGEYPAGGPLAHLKDIWKAGAPSIDFISPDIYDTGFKDWVNSYTTEDNILFVPEVKRENANSAQAYYIFGHNKAIGISPFSIENGDENYYKKLASTYSVIKELKPFLMEYPSEGFILTSDEPSEVYVTDSIKITLSHYFTLPWDSRAKDKNNWKDAGCILFQLSPEEYILAGSGVVAKFEDINETFKELSLGEDGFAQETSKVKQETGKASRRIGLEKVEEIKVNPDGSFLRKRSFNGDETHQGRHVRINVDDDKILYIKIYKYE